MNGDKLSACNDDALKSRKPCFQLQGRSVLVQTGTRSIREEKRVVVLASANDAPKSASALFTCKNAWTTPGQSLYVVGDAPALGNWDASRGVKMEPVEYPIWTALVENLPAGRKINWKCVKRSEQDVRQVSGESGVSSVSTEAEGYAGESAIKF